MSKVAEAMEMYEIILIDHTLEETKAFLEEHGYFVIHEEPEVRRDDNTRELGVLTVEGLEDPMKYGFHKTRPAINGKCFYYW